MTKKSFIAIFMMMLLAPLSAWRLRDEKNTVTYTPNMDKQGLVLWEGELDVKTFRSWPDAVYPAYIEIDQGGKLTLWVDDWDYRINGGCLGVKFGTINPGEHYACFDWINYKLVSSWLTSVAPVVVQIKGGYINKCWIDDQFLLENYRAVVNNSMRTMAFKKSTYTNISGGIPFN